MLLLGSLSRRRRSEEAPGRPQKNEDRECPGHGSVSVPIVSQPLDDQKRGHRDQCADIEEDDPMRHKRRAFMVAAGHFRGHGHVRNIEQRVTAIDDQQRTQHISDEPRLIADGRRVEDKSKSDRADGAAQHEERAPPAPPRRRPIADDAHQRVGHHVVQLGDQQQGRRRARANTQKVGHERSEDTAHGIQDDCHAHCAGAEVDAQARRERAIGTCGIVRR